MVTKYFCYNCGCLRKNIVCQKCGEKTFIPHSSWEDPELPDVNKIREIAYKNGYAIGEHGTKERDLDLIAAPWTEDAVDSYVFLDNIAKNINGKLIYIEKKPLGRIAATIQIDGYFKPIDISVCPIIK